MTTAKHIPQFAEGAIAFRYSLNGTLQAWKVFGFRLNSKGQREYRLYRDGLDRWEPASNLLSGWEDNFPGYDAVDWGHLHRTDSDNLGDLAEMEAQELKETFVNIDYFSELSEKYETA